MPAQLTDTPHVTLPSKQLLMQTLADRKSRHRLLWLDGEEVTLRQKLAADPELQFIWQTIRQTCDVLLTRPPLVREMIGRRLLETSRLAVVRTTHLGMAYRLTGDGRYARRAIGEMLAIAGFSDWGPFHFLDVAEMTTAMAIGLDWCRDAMSDAERTAIQNAIIEKGLTPSLPPNQHDHWMRAENNWNQVCHTGMLLGAMAVDDIRPDLAAGIIARAVECLPFAMKAYAPDGGYPEGPAYWTYGTTYNVIGIAALQALLGTDFGLSNQLGFLSTAEYFLHVFGPSGAWFNYSDTPPQADRCPAAAAFYLARVTGDSSVLLYQRQWIRSRMQDASTGNGTLDWDNWHSQLPLLLLWAEPALRQQVPPLHYLDRGPTPIATHRTSWDPDATYVAIKAGTASANHGHMDAGSFVIDAMGERFVEGIGRQDYESLESAKVDLWNGAQDGGRWKVFRMGPFAKNVLTVNEQLHCVDGKATITRSTSDQTIIDLTPVFKNQLAFAQREVHLHPTGVVILRDEVAAGTSPATVRFAFLTRASIKQVDHGVILTLNKNSLKVTLSGDAPGTMECFSTVGPMPYDESNEGTRLLGFRITLAPQQRATWELHFQPS
jgi:hypothetical protein